MSKNKKEIERKLEQLYFSTIDNITSKRKPDEDDVDVPNVPEDKQYKTHYDLQQLEDKNFEEDEKILTDPSQNTDIPPEPLKKEPEIKTKKGKNILRDQSSNKSEPIEVKVLYKKPKSFKEQVQKDPNQMEKMYSTNVGVDEEDPYPVDQSQQQIDPNQQMIPQDQMGGMGGIGVPLSGEVKTAEEIGRIYELKKIYTRLIAIDSQLSFSSDIIVVKLRAYISKAIDLFETLIHNVSTFKDKIDEIIIMYYNFLSEVYSLLKRYYKIKDKKNENIN